MRPHFIDNEVDSIEALKCLDIADSCHFGMKSGVDRKNLKNDIDTLEIID